MAEQEGFPHLIPEAARLVVAAAAVRFSFIERDKVIETPMFDAVQARLQELYAHHRVIRPPNIAIVGPSGIGKTHAIDDFMSRKRPRRSHTTGRLKVPALHVEYPPLPNNRWFAATLAKGLGYHLPLPRRESDIFDLLLGLLESAGTRLLITEEVNQLEDWPRQHLREFYGLTRWLSNQTQIPMALSGTEQVLDLINGDVQLSRRFDRLELAPWRLDQNFAGFISAYVRTVPLRRETLIDRSLIERVHEVGQGITDTTVKVLQRAAKRAILSGVERIEIGLVDDDATVSPPSVRGRKVVRRKRRKLT